MNYYRITKYDPKLRDEKGHYLLDEWTSIFDVGKVFNEKLVTMEDYLKCENGYIQAIVTVLKDNSVTKMHIVGLERHDERDISDLSDREKTLLRNIRNGMGLNLDEIKTVVKLVLRELMWCKLCSFAEMEINFGYDYYMYIKSNNLKKDTVQKLYSYGMFVEIMTNGNIDGWGRTWEPVGCNQEHQTVE
ncbi:MAG: hypothetical protein ACI3XA_09805 [Clostridia bacterium]